MRTLPFYVLAGGGGSGSSRGSRKDTERALDRESESLFSPRHDPTVSPQYRGTWSREF